MKTAVVIPALNEEAALPRVLAALRQAGAHDILVVDNGSTDATARVAVDGGSRVVAEPRRGYGRACLTGLSTLAARAEGPPETVVFVDADYSDHPGEIALVTAPIEAGRADLVIGSRVLGRRDPGALLPQARYGNWLATRLIRLATGVRFTDLGPFRAITWLALQKIGMRDQGFGWTVEMQMKAAQAGLRCEEVPVSYRKRIGTSKITGTISGTVKAGAKILATIGWLSVAGASARRQRP